MAVSINGIILSSLSTSDLAALVAAIRAAVAGTTKLDIQYVSVPVLTQASTRLLRSADNAVDLLDASTAKIGAAFTVNPPATVLQTAMNELNSGSSTSTDPAALSNLFATAIFSGSGSALTTQLATNLADSGVTALTTLTVSVTSAPSLILITDAPTASPTAAPKKDAEVLSTGAIIGIAVGGGGGLILLVALLAYFVCMQKSSAVGVDNVKYTKQVPVQSTSHNGQLVSTNDPRAITL